MGSEPWKSRAESHSGPECWGQWRLKWANYIQSENVAVKTFPCLFNSEKNGLKCYLLRVKLQSRTFDMSGGFVEAECPKKVKRILLQLVWNLHLVSLCPAVIAFMVCSVKVWLSDIYIFPSPNAVGNTCSKESFFFIALIVFFHD